MEDEGGFKRMVEEILEVMRDERRIGAEDRLGRVIVSAHSGGIHYRFQRWLESSALGEIER